MPLLLLTGTNLYVTLFSLATAGFYVAFAFPVVALLVVRLRRRWEPGPFSLGRWGIFVNGAAVLWLTAEVVNIAWPRLVGAPWYQNYSVVIMLCAITIAGAAGYRLVRHRVRVFDSVDPTQALSFDDSAVPVPSAL